MCKYCPASITSEDVPCEQYEEACKLTTKHYIRERFISYDGKTFTPKEEE